MSFIKKTNYFLLLNTPVQNRIAKKLKQENNYVNDENILIHRVPIFGKYNEVDKHEWGKIYKVPFVASEKKVVKWLNLIFYLLVFSVIYINQKKGGSLILGNYPYNGNRSICNFFLRDWKSIYIIDEGLSTVVVWNKRRQLHEENERLNFLSRLLKTQHPKRALIFYTSFFLDGANAIDIVNKIDELYPKRVGDYNIDNNTILFIGTPLVENNLITRETFEKTLNKAFTINSGKTLKYVAHPKEKFIFESKFASYLGFEIITPSVKLEDYLQISEDIPSVISSCTSTALIYASFILGSKVKYQVYVIDKDDFLDKEAALKLHQVYNTIEHQLSIFDSKKIFV